MCSFEKLAIKTSESVPRSDPNNVAKFLNGGETDATGKVEVPLGPSYRCGLAIAEDYHWKLPLKKSDGSREPQARAKADYEEAECRS